MRAPNVQIFTHQIRTISGIADGARITIFARDGEEIFSEMPPLRNVSVPIEGRQYPVRICVSKEGYTPFTLAGLQDGSLVEAI